ALAVYDYEIIFVDDNSSDGTAELATSLQTEHPIKMIVRKDKRGLASAVVDGLSKVSGKYVVVMDADLQHPPEVVPNLIKTIDEGADIAVASRYIKGGGCQGWSLTRRLISRGAILLAHLLLPATRKVNDPMSGFFIFKKEIATDTSLNPAGFKILLEILMVGKFKKVIEIPFIFITREKGESKLNTRQQIDYLKHIYSLMQRTGEILRFIKFALVGGSGVVVNYGLYWILTRFAGFIPLDDEITGGITSGNLAMAISIETSIITNFLLNNYFTFADRSTRGILPFFGRLLNFNLICLIGGLIQIGVANLLAITLGIYDLIAIPIAIITATLWNYLLNNWWTWRH
ncbi:MAG: glycosyltransferase family 2 protein, partial [Dehalococcoidia bacterium]